MKNPEPSCDVRSRVGFLWTAAANLLVQLDAPSAADPAAEIPQTSTVDCIVFIFALDVLIETSLL